MTLIELLKKWNCGKNDIITIQIEGHDEDDALGYVVNHEPMCSLNFWMVKCYIYDEVIWFQTYEADVKGETVGAMHILLSDSHPVIEEKDKL